MLARLAYRDGLCRHLTITDGECTTEAGSVMVSTRSASEYGVEVGDTVTLRGRAVQIAGPDSARALTVAGLYTPVDADDPYWGRGGFFAAGMPDSESSLPRADAVFVGDEQDLALPGSLPSVHLDYRLRTDTVRLDDVERLRADLGSFETAVNAAEMQLSTALRGVIADIDADATALGRTVPIDRRPARTALLVRALPARRGADRGAGAGDRAGQAARLLAGPGGSLRPGRGPRC